MAPSIVKECQTLACVICHTKRQAFHPLLYANFILQSYEPKELVVVDTGTKPSLFLQEKALEDPRHFAVSDSRETDAMAVLLVEDGVSLVTADAVKRRRGLSFKPCSGWSLGFKGNPCCHVSRGQIIAHSDDDDAYAANYIMRMTNSLLSVRGSTRTEWSSYAAQAAVGPIPGQ
mmetsp:Transcript_17990/g.31352  ORF Transcript_17990/g.31352 Transcript_17990/m.31352 type:complete len:174 (-) Transcript_17990:135-656(-)